MELSIRGYAKHRGISETAVRKAIKAGRITKNKNDKIDSNLADNQWQKNTDPAQIKEPSKSQQTAKQDQEKVNGHHNISGQSPLSLGPSYQQSRAIKEAYNAKLTRLQFERESKKLISADEVKVSAFNAARMTRDRMFNIPDRVIPQLVGKTDIHQMKELLKIEITKALEGLSNNDKL
ncbi:MAG: pyruvate/2-oxoglutarate dehydrogenase complex dihydrolipoamide acyltransferase (E2) component [Rickettsiales bacterium]|jgi:pyruvate/2-oxoglutarate dehydrogenase complex dihydrolipoamide acyltransferase (E2) component